jgi:hypothetical protein
MEKRKQRGKRNKKEKINQLITNYGGGLRDWNQ